MKNEPSDLPGVVKELVQALLDGDWVRYADDSSERFYYIIRQEDHDLESAKGHDFNRMLTFGKYETNAFEDWYIRSALAEEPPDRLGEARKRVAKAGVDPKFFDSVIEACRSARSREELRKVLQEWTPRFVEGSLEALIAVLEGLRIDRVRREQIFVSEADRPEIRAALEARFLRELSERFPKVVGRATGFDWLLFNDRQVREASRCYLYGFFQATVLLAAAALEARLKRIACVDRLLGYDALVDSVFGQAGVCGRDDARAAALKDLFELRNRIAHEGVMAERDQAKSALDVVRETFEVLAQRMDEVV